MSDKSQRPRPQHIARLDALQPQRGTLVTAYGVISSVREGRTRKNDPFFDLVLADTTARVRGKIWSDAPAGEQIGALAGGTPVKALFEVDEYQGAAQANIKKLRAATDDDEGYDEEALFGPGWRHVRDLVCPTLVFDIETVPATHRRALPTTVAEALARHAERFDSDEAKLMGLSPLFGKVVSIAVGNGDLDPKDQPVTVLAVPRDGAASDDLPEWIRPMPERDLLEAWWSLAALAETVVSFNGRGFDVPFLVVRSLLLDVPARVDLLGNRFGLRPHLDLHRVLAHGERIAGPANLDVLCWALGIESPKESMDGSMVAPAYEAGQLQRICEYNAHDVRATTAVYHAMRDRVLRFRDDW